MKLRAPYSNQTDEQRNTTEKKGTGNYKCLWICVIVYYCFYCSGGDGGGGCGNDGGSTSCRSMRRNTGENRRMHWASVSLPFFMARHTQNPSRHIRPPFSHAEPRSLCLCVCVCVRTGKIRSFAHRVNLYTQNGVRLQLLHCTGPRTHCACVHMSR